MVPVGKVEPQRFAQRRVDGDSRVQGEERVLEHHLDVAGPRKPGRAATRPYRPWDAAHEDLARVRALQAHDDAGGGRLAGAGLADDAE